MAYRLHIWHVDCIYGLVGNTHCVFPERIQSGVASAARSNRRPPVWRAVVRPARSFFAPVFFASPPLQGATSWRSNERMNGEHLDSIHQALTAVQQAVLTMTFPSCDQEDVVELIDRVEAELHTRHPNTALVCTFLNSIARSLRAQPEARDACLAIEGAIGAAGMPSTWQSGI